MVNLPLGKPSVIRTTSCSNHFSISLETSNKRVYCIYNIFKASFRHCLLYLFTKYSATFVLFCLYLFYKIFSDLCFVLFISLLQNIQRPLFCFVYIYFTKYSATFVLFCLYLFYKIFSDPRKYSITPITRTPDNSNPR